MRLSSSVAGFVLLPIISAITVGCEADAPNPSQPNPNPTAPVTAVLTLGRLEPDGEVIKLSVPNAQNSHVDQLLVKESDRVHANQVIAILQGINRRAAEVRDADAEVALRTAELEKARSGEAKSAQTTAQEQTIKKVEAQLSSTMRQRQAAIASAKARLHNANQDSVRKATLASTRVIASLKSSILFERVVASRNCPNAPPHGRNVKNNITQILTKLNLRDRTQAALWAQKYLSSERSEHFHKT